MNPRPEKQTKEAPRPWYREPWPWVVIAIPLLTVIASGFTFWLAVSHPDYLVLKEEDYAEVSSELRVQQGAENDPAETGQSADRRDGER